MGDAGLNRLFSSLEASFEAAITAEDDVLAHDLAMSLRQGRTLTDVAARSGPIDLIQISGVRLPVEVVGEDFVGVVGVQSMLFPMRRAVLSPGIGHAPRWVQISMLAVVRSVARKRGLATHRAHGAGSATKGGSWLLARITFLYGPPSENYSLALMPSIGSGSRKVSLLARDSTLGLWIQGMCLRPGLSLFVKSLEVGLELRPIYTPNPTAAKLDSRKVPGSNERCRPEAR